MYAAPGTHRWVAEQRAARARLRRAAVERVARRVLFGACAVLVLLVVLSAGFGP